ncbi:hypothetical protein F6X53_21345 [Methylobacterium soli]|uniref:Uncharacterized protein n=1 Tax=Methylobacterium soli TaxID=553447 RepID=A0A6L3STA2_9HYPH|nr:hypothetical protein F6X53_21345 [Methylobacterium soli]
MTSSRSGRRAPVVLSQISASRRRQGRASVLGADALDAPLPGPLLILLSRLHRAEGPQEGRPAEAPLRDEGLAR